MRGNAREKREREACDDAVIRRGCRYVMPLFAVRIEIPRFHRDATSVIDPSDPRMGNKSRASKKENGSPIGRAREEEKEARARDQYLLFGVDELPFRQERFPRCGTRVVVMRTSNRHCD